MAGPLKETIADLVRPHVEAMDLTLFDVEIAGASHAPVVRVFLEKADGAIDMDAIATASRAISALLDENGPLAGRYTLEVSSPGLDRPLRDLADFAHYVGRNAQVT